MLPPAKLTESKTKQIEKIKQFRRKTNADGKLR
jgi:hypothetical protein